MKELVKGLLSLLKVKSIISKKPYVLQGLLRTENIGLFILHRAIPMSSDVGYTRRKENSLHRAIPVSSDVGYTHKKENS